MWSIVPAMRASACLLALCAISASFALTVNKTNLLYHNYFMDNSKGEYYAKAEDILRAGDVSRGDPAMRSVDDMLYDYVNIAAKPPMYKDCVPFISQYSDCSIETICLGCTLCHCGMLGSWNCSLVQKCRADPTLLVDHRVLTIVMEHLLEEDTTLLNRRKRSTDYIEDSFTDHEDFSKWMYGISPFDFEDDVNNTKRTDLDEITTKANLTIDPDFFNFEQFLIDIGYDFNFENEENSTDGMKINYSKHEDMFQHDLTSNNYKDFVNMLENVSSATYIDSTINKQQKNTLLNAQHRIDNIIPNTEIPVNSQTSIYDFKTNIPHNITKREVFRTNTEINYLKNESITIFIKNITENSFYPLDNIIKVKEDELNELINIRDNLIGSISAYFGVEVSNITNSIFKKPDLRFIIYKLDSSNLTNPLRSDNRSLLEKYQIKLKNDIGQVIKDIAVIQRLPKSSNVTHELTYLIRALKHYVKKLPGKYIQRSYSVSTNINFSRRFYNSERKTTNPIVLINNIFELLDKDMPQGNVLSLLSQNAVKLLTRIINQLYFDELSAVQSKLQDERYDLANDLKKIGSKWQYRITDINNSIPSERIYKIKLFHLEISCDINTLKDVLVLLGFAERRRMSLIEDLNSKKAVMENLSKIHNNIKQIAKMTNTLTMRNTPRPKRRKIKQGFLQKVKRLLNKSKQDIRGIFRKKAATPEMIKLIAKKRLNDITKKKLSRYEDAMYRWQDNLNIVPRIKRSANEFNNFMNRVKNIIPGYLHKKVKPAVDSRKKNKNGRRNVTRHVKKHRRHNTSKTPLKHETTTTMKPRRRQQKHSKHH